jgi:hypothetical protein
MQVDTMAVDRDGKTRPVQQGPGKKGLPETAPRLPHEHDESSDSQQSAPRPEIQQAHDDLAAGRVDTDRGAPANAAYQKQKSPTDRK